MRSPRNKLNRIAKQALILGKSNSDLYGSCSTTGLQTWGCKYFGYSRSAAVMHIMIERILSAIRAIDSTPMGIDLMQVILLKQYGLVGKSIASYIRYRVGNETKLHTLSEPLDSLGENAQVEITRIPDVTDVVYYILVQLDYEEWTRRCMMSLLSTYSNYCMAVLRYGENSTTPNAEIVSEASSMLQLATRTAEKACMSMDSKPSTFTDTLAAYGWYVKPLGSNRLLIRHNTVNDTPPLDWVAPIEDTED